MTTVEAFAKAGWAAARQSRAERKAKIRAAGKAAVTGLAAIRRAVLQVAGLAGFTVAAWSVDFRLGIAIGSVCAFVLVWLLEGE